MKTTLIMVAITATSIALTSCIPNLGQQPEPTPTPTPMPVERCYDMLLKLHESNPTLLEDMEGATFRCEGKITKIKDASIQFHINKIKLKDLREIKLPEDQYIDCEFSRREDVHLVKIGGYAAFKGKLDKAFSNRVPPWDLAGKNGVVEFKDCRLI